MTVSGWATARLSEGYGSSAAGSLALQVTVTSRLALEAAGGSHLPDLYQGFPASGFVTLGARVFLLPRPLRPRSAGTTVLRPAMAVREGDSVRVRFVVPGVQRLAIAGDWSEWRPIALGRGSGDSWQARVALSRGIYRFSLVADGVRWLVPAGVATVDDGMGGSVGLLVVP